VRPTGRYTEDLRVLLVASDFRTLGGHMIVGAIISEEK